MAILPAAMGAVLLLGWAAGTAQPVLESDGGRGHDTSEGEAKAPDGGAEAGPTASGQANEEEDVGPPLEVELDLSADAEPESDAPAATAPPTAPPSPRLDEAGDTTSVEVDSVELLLGEEARASDPSTRVTVLPVRRDGEPTPLTPAGLDEAVVAAVRQAGDRLRGRYVVQGRGELLAAASGERRRQLLACADPSCLRRVATWRHDDGVTAGAADRVAAFALRRAGGAWVLEGELVDWGTGELLAESQRHVEGDAQLLVSAVPLVVGDLFGVELPPDSTALPAPAPGPRFAVQLDLAGAALQGPTLTAEVGSRVAALARLRLTYLGVLTHVLAHRPEAGESLDVAVAGGVGVRLYAGREGALRGAFCGAGAEYWYSRAADREHDRAAYDHHAVLGLIELGYRWAFERFFLGGGVWGGYLATVGSGTVDLSGAGRQLAAQTQGDTFTGGVSLEVGVYF